MENEVLDVVESEKFCEKYGVKFGASGVAHNEDEAVNIAKKIGYPVVMKIVSKDIVHKSEAKAVKTWVEDDDEARDAYTKIIDSVKKHKEDAHIDGVQVQDQMEKGIEVIIGAKRDPQFGPVVIFGLGGIMVEVLKDVSMRICPIEKKEAEEMIREIHAHEVLSGVRGNKGVDIEAIVDAIMKISNLMMKEDNVLELDLNPMFATRRDLVAADARIILKR